jgi:hypothetical protein
MGSIERPSAYQRLGLGVAAGLTAALAIAGCSHDERVTGPDHCFGCGIDPTIRIDRSMAPQQQARAIGRALNREFVVAGVRVARGYELRWDRPPSNVNIYPREHIVQPLVFGSGLYGYTVPFWTGSMPAPSQKHDVFIQLLRTDLPLEPLERDGEPASDPHVETVELHLVPNHPLQGLMPYAEIVSAFEADDPLADILSAGLTRDNRS